MSETEREYFRRDVQGLRGVAVLLVVIYHSGVGLPGGFIGVDMFFVISGYVISMLLLRELKQTGKIVFREFYARRARRLLPALALVTLATLLLSILFLSPFGGQQEVVRSSQATTLFLANAHFFLENTYFSLAGNPFRHMWSLAIEEQFYLLLPVTLFGVWRLTSKLSMKRQHNLLVAFTLLITFVSFLIGVALSFGFRLTPLPERFAFFGLPSRIWEFGVGVLLGLVPLRNNFLKKNSLLTFGLAFIAIIWSVFRLASFTPFPGVVALAPVLGTAGLIVAGQNSERISKWLSCKRLVRIGDISYGWYLWHWPFIVFCLTLWPENNLFALIAGIVSLLPTLLSYRFLEQPIRMNQNIAGLRALRMTVVCVVVPLGFSFVSERVADTHLGLVQPELKPRAGIADDCGFTVDSDKWNQDECTFTVQNSKGKIYLFGDSQARAFADGVIKAGNSLGYDVSVLATAGCPVASEAPLGVSWCESIQLRLLELSGGCNYSDGLDWSASWCSEQISKKPALVVIGNSYTRYLGDEYRLPNSRGDLPKEFQSRVESVSNSISVVIEKLHATQVPVLIIHEAPSVTVSLEVSLLKRSSGIEPRNYSEQVGRNSVVKDVEQNVLGLNKVLTFDPATALCTQNKCLPTRDGLSLYYDSSHLNVRGSEMLAGLIKSKLEALLG